MGMVFTMIKELQFLLKNSENIDSALIVSPENRRYFTEFPSSDGFLLVTRDDAVFITDSRYIEAAGNKVTECKTALQKREISQVYDFFKSNGYISRGISGQTSYQFLLRFREDVINLSPALVVINAGTNDVAENTNVYNEDQTFGNIVSMVELAKANKIKVILTSVLPAAAFKCRMEIKDAPQKIQALNARIEAYAKANKIPFVNYYKVMVVDENQALNPQYTKDGVHPTSEGYDIMEPLIKSAIDKAL